MVPLRAPTRARQTARQWLEQMQDVNRAIARVERGEFSV